MKLAVDGVIVTVHNGTITEQEALAYVQRGREQYSEHLTEIVADIDPQDPESISLEYKWQGKPFQRLRRITGYLVGTMDHWNNGKRAEEHDRVKHDTNTGG